MQKAKIIKEKSPIFAFLEKHRKKRQRKYEKIQNSLLSQKEQAKNGKENKVNT